MTRNATRGIDPMIAAQLRVHAVCLAVCLAVALHLFMGAV